MAPKRGRMLEKRDMNDRDIKKRCDGEEVVMYVTKPYNVKFSHVEKVAKLKVAKLNMTRACTAPSTCTDMQRSAYLIGFLANIFPREREAFGNALAKMGVKVMWKEMPFDDEEKEHEPKLQEEPVTVREIAFVLGLVVMFLYRNVPDGNITSSVKASVEALSAESFVVPGEFKTPTFFRNLGYVTAYRQIMGPSYSIRCAVLEAIIANTGQQNFIGIMCSYLFKYLEWTDMSAMMLIHKTLQITDSPVLRCHQVADEVKNYRAAVLAANKCRYPKFLRILGNKHDHSLAGRDKFPVLFAVSKRIQFGSAENARDIRSAANCPEDLVTYLVDKHITHIRKIERAFSQEPTTIIANLVIKACEKLQKYL